MISWIGGKNRISKWIIEYIPQDVETYLEPCGGMFWVFFKMDLKKYPNLKNVIYNDINSLNVNLFKCLKDPDRLYDEMSKYPTQVMGEVVDPQPYIDVFNSCQKEIFDSNFIVPTETDFDVACKYLYVLTHVFSGSKPATSKYIYYKGVYRDKFLVFKDKLNKKDWVEHFQRINIVENMDVCDVMEKYDSENTFIYQDLPYYNTEHYYSNHDFGINDHERVKNCMINLKSKFAMSYYDFPLLSEWYPKDRYHWESKEFPKSAAARKDTPQNKGLELLIMNY